ncbi:bifunctional phosphopantothenoylcysteine decarboxylase/phosphopantothenate--cysteine ligase CoaBC [Acidianus sulfidivorans JP7]|uniref:Coenzyme A biosynthesis bifunctional protein CoaBC n=2 Tax=Acidianus TaxID=12914 RepID=A0A2U9IQH4_9CREN|nr:bifunctional phosphopantothenoylcysteine decarboxylase/phosphopantothenate--cysteine ligase CoaBC [Acidianus sulfidivorans JP7]
MLHPSKRIIGEISDELKDKKILLAVTASVSIYKSLDLARSLMRRGAEVSVVMSQSAKKMISPMLFEWATGNKVISKISGELEHITIPQEYDAMVIAPATMNIMAKLSNGITDNDIILLAVNFIQNKKKVFIVPAMHLEMWLSQFMINIVTALKKIDGVEIVEPYIVREVAHYPDVEYLTSRITSNILRGNDLKGMKIIVTAGPTREYLDPVRYLSNPSSGTMGVAIANEALFRGADVTLVHGPLTTNIKPYTKEVAVETTDEMLKAILDLMEKEKYNIVILAGAPADYKFKEMAKEKIDSHSEVPKVELEKTPKLSNFIRDKGFIVGFAAETVNNDDELIQKATIKKQRHGFNIIVANNVKRRDIGFSSSYDEVIIISDNNIIKIDKTYKTIIARKLLDIVKEEFIKVKS